ncbi:MAG: hypothetical protein WDO74_15795 [Pseudomonadota bacterium]
MAFELGQWGITCNSFGATPIMTDMIKGVPQDKIDAVVNNSPSSAWARTSTAPTCAIFSSIQAATTSPVRSSTWAASLKRGPIMIAPWLFERIVAWGDAPALVWNDTVASYAELAQLSNAGKRSFRPGV